MSKDHLSSNNSLLHKPLVSLESFLEDFVCSQKGPASIKVPQKNTQVGKYVVCNEALVHRDDILIQDYIGLDSYSIGEIMHHGADVIENAIEMDRRIYTGNIPYAQYKQVLPTGNSLLCIEEVTKKPILSRDGKVLGLFACASDVTGYLDPLYLFSEYQKYYSTKEAIRHFCRYLRIQHLFYELPTKRELETLLMMRRSNATKYIAKAMQLSPKTVEENKGRLRNNLKLITLNDLVIKLRVRNEFQDA